MGGLLLGVAYISSGFKDATAFANLILVLLIRPQGIGVQPRVKLVEPGSLNREAETSPRVIDLLQ